ncbi:hypothetical protein H5410_060413 [Solanum commersonii]|uniref:Uncharacterized protein n=1 Tax=Solanum commersonii TaxID=4109 RepID=A0A9J5W5K1_SOLCO|nr:hypothetical protein H5410_060413 [Solanum commersonii]
MICLTFKLGIDSLSLMLIIRDTRKISWEIAEKDYSDTEANQFHNFRQLPSTGRRLLNMGKIVVRLLTSLRYVSGQYRTSVKSEERGTGNPICNKGVHPTKSLRRKNLRASWISPPFFQQEENIKSTTKEKREKRRGKD